MEHKNIIANDCVGARIYQQKGTEFGNPFMWCLIPPESFSYLYHHYREINFRNIELKKDGEWYKVVIDRKVTVYYPHYRFDKDARTPTKRKGQEIDIYYCRIYEYILEKYWKRLERMKGEPIFIINDGKTGLVGGKCSFYRKDVEEYVGRDDCFILTDDRTITGRNVIHRNEPKISSGDSAKLIIEKTGI